LEEDNSKKCRAARAECINPECKKVFFHFRDFKEMFRHYQSVHKSDFVMFEKRFSSEKDFENWRDNEQKDSYMYPAMMSNTRENERSVLYEYYVCQKDVVRPYSRNIIPRNKKGVVEYVVCPARMYVEKRNIPDGMDIMVTYCNFHSHELKFSDTKHHRLPRDVVTNIESMIHLGVGNRHVKHQYESSLIRFDDFEGMKWSVDYDIPSKKIKTRRSKIRKIDLLHEKESTSLDMKVHNLGPSVFVYKRQGQETSEIGNLDLSHIKCAKKRIDTFVLGIQSERMRRMMAQGVERCLNVDGKFGTNIHDFQLLSFIVPTEFAEVYPVVFIITNCQDEKTLEKIFRILKERSPVVHTVITDDERALHNALSTVYNDGKYFRHLYVTGIF